MHDTVTIAPGWNPAEPMVSVIGDRSTVTTDSTMVESCEMVAMGPILEIE
jgi:hypothetical protein